MSNNQPYNGKSAIELTDRSIEHNFDSLVAKSQKILEQILDDPEVSTAEKSEIALKILQIATSRHKSNQANFLSNKNASNINGHNLPLTLVNSIESKISQAKAAKQKSSFIKTNSQLFPAHYLQLDNFLSSEEHQQALDIVLSKQNKFVESKTVTNAANYRQSSILYATLFPKLYYLVKNKITDILPSILSQLNHPEFFVSHVEMQMTAHNDGCFYKVHTDASSEKTKTRELTYVYYFYQEPKQFFGGELKLYETEIQNGSFIQKENSQIIEPRNNSIVFFNSRCKHEVLMVNCPSKNFKDSRFTINGWLRR